MSAIFYLQIENLKRSLFVYYLIYNLSLNELKNVEWNSSANFAQRVKVIGLGQENIIHELSPRFLSLL
jgi:Na+/melibiose symporter-like transporter